MDALEARLLTHLPPSPFVIIMALTDDESRTFSPSSRWRVSKRLRVPFLSVNVLLASNNKCRLYQLYFSARLRTE